MTLAITQRFDVGFRAAGDLVAPWLHALPTIDGTAPRTLVHGMDLRGPFTPAALRSRVRHRMAQVRLDLLADREVRRALVVALVEDTAAQDRVCPGFTGASESMRHRIEMMRGTPLGLTVMVVPRSAPAEGVRSRILEGAHLLPDGAAVVTWDEVDGWGLRAAAAYQQT